MVDTCKSARALSRLPNKLIAIYVTCWTTHAIRNVPLPLLRAPYSICVQLLYYTYVCWQRRRRSLLENTCQRTFANDFSFRKWVYIVFAFIPSVPGTFPRIIKYRSSTNRLSICLFNESEQETFMLSMINVHLFNKEIN